MKERFIRDKYVENCRKIEMVEEIMPILKYLYKVLRSRDKMEWRKFHCDWYNR